MKNIQTIRKPSTVSTIIYKNFPIFSNINIIYLNDLFVMIYFYYVNSTEKRQYNFHLIMIVFTSYCCYSYCLFGRRHCQCPFRNVKRAKCAKRLPTKLIDYNSKSIKVLL